MLVVVAFFSCGVLKPFWVEYIKSYTKIAGLKTRRFSLVGIPGSYLGMAKRRCVDAESSILNYEVLPRSSR